MKKSEKYAIYLRKSRPDIEQEKQGQCETLARHRAALLDLAQKRHYNIVKIYEELVSGDSIVSRPQMQELLHDVESGIYTGILVMEIERLARGDTIDQGVVAQTFKQSDTLIITPFKTFDPNSEADENYFEFSLFMSRQEYKTIKRRLNQGRYASAKEGKYLGSRPPFGYERVKIPDGKGHTLAIVEEEAAVIRLIFNLYVYGVDGKRLGIQAIARYLNEHNIAPQKNNYWGKESVSKILDNPVYAGKIRYGYRKYFQKIVNGHKVTTRPVQYRDNYILSEGLHPAIISQEIYDKVQELSEHRPIMPVGYKSAIKNPLAGLIICKVCGRRMAMRGTSSKYPNKPIYLVCHNRNCNNVSSPLYIVENRVLSALGEWCKRYQLEICGESDPPANIELDALTAALKSTESKHDTLQKQLSNCYDLLERGIYTDDVFVQRSEHLKSEISSTIVEIDRIKTEISTFERRQKVKSEFVPHVMSIMQAYHETSDIPAKNELLREILDHATYYKEKSAAHEGVSVDDFELDIFPRLPK